MPLSLLISEAIPGNPPHFGPVVLHRIYIFIYNIFICVSQSRSETTIPIEIKARVAMTRPLMTISKAVQEDSPSSAPVRKSGGVFDGPSKLVHVLVSEGVWDYPTVYSCASLWEDGGDLPLLVNHICKGGLGTWECICNHAHLRIGLRLPKSICPSCLWLWRSVRTSLCLHLHSSLKDCSWKTQMFLFLCPSQKRSAVWRPRSCVVPLVPLIMNTVNPQSHCRVCARMECNGFLWVHNDKSCGCHWKNRNHQLCFFVNRSERYETVPHEGEQQRSICYWSRRWTSSQR